MHLIRVNLCDCVQPLRTALLEAMPKKRNQTHSYNTRLIKRKRGSTQENKAAELGSVAKIEAGQVQQTETIQPVK